MLPIRSCTLFDIIIEPRPSLLGMLRQKLILILVAFAFCLLLPVHIILIPYYSNPETSRIERNIIYEDRSHDQFISNRDRQSSDATAESADLTNRIKDLRRVKLSLNNELRIIFRDKAKVLDEIYNLEEKREKLLLQIAKSKSQLKQLEIDLTANKRRKSDKACDNLRAAPIVFKPLESHPIEEYSLVDNGQLSSDNELAVRMSTTVEGDNGPYRYDFSKCSLTKDFTFTLKLLGRVSSQNEDSSIVDIVRAHPFYTTDREEDSCLTINIIEEAEETLLLEARKQLVESRNRNNLIIDLTQDQEKVHRLFSNQASIASAGFQNNTFRPQLDVVLPSRLEPVTRYNSLIGSRPLMSPLERKYVASYFGCAERSAKYKTIKFLEKVLQTIHRTSLDDPFLFIYDCGLATGKKCYDERDKLIELSQFLVILPPPPGVPMDKHTNELVSLALLRGAIPVIIGRAQVRLPFDEVLDWRLASIMLPESRLPELQYILRVYDSADLYQMKYHARRFFENHLATTKQVVDSLLALLSVERFNLLPPAVDTIKIRAHRIVNSSHSILNGGESEVLSSTLNQTSTSDEILGPHEVPLKSTSFRRNVSLSLNMNYRLWNEPTHSAIRLYPSLPLDPVRPSEYKFLASGSDLPYRPINRGLSGAGFEFSRDLGGDWPSEQFTVVLLTYERTQMLLKTLERFRGMPYVNKYLIVWNSVNRPPTADIAWPDMGAPLVVLNVKRNSLNNRFLPFDQIETDAILSLDDDSPLRQDEIIFAFRVWRESRDRIVGFPGRFHTWDQEHNCWMYNSNHSCELSMVLTGGAFFHRFYSYAYTFEMPNAIRSIVDNFMNCEDIAINFLVAHLTRKPPIKVTSRWTFHCAGCPSSLSDDESHFRERHECLNIFASIYGYMPLLSTQHRSDSILFKTRLPADKQKCFKFV